MSLDIHRCRCFKGCSRKFICQIKCIEAPCLLCGCFYSRNNVDPSLHQKNPPKHCSNLYKENGNWDSLGQRIYPPPNNPNALLYPTITTIHILSWHYRQFQTRWKAASSVDSLRTAKGGPLFRCSASRYITTTSAITQIQNATRAAKNTKKDTVLSCAIH